jgi:RNA polymerase sigma-70 factor (ECF subfamily)
VETEQLVIEAQAGDASALERLLGNCRPRLMRYASGWLRNEDAAQDVVQETLVKVAGHLDQLSDPAAFASWVFTILRRNGFELFRRERRRGTASVSFDDALLAPAAADRESAVDEEFELEQCLDRLKTDDRDLLRLHYWVGLELGEIAPMLGITRGAAKVRLFRARGRLKQLLGAS